MLEAQLAEVRRKREEREAIEDAYRGFALAPLAGAAWEPHAAAGDLLDPALAAVIGKSGGIRRNAGAFLRLLEQEDELGYVFSFPCLQPPRGPGVCERLRIAANIAAAAAAESLRDLACSHTRMTAR